MASTNKTNEAIAQHLSVFLVFLSMIEMTMYKLIILPIRRPRLAPPQYYVNGPIANLESVAACQTKPDLAGLLGPINRRIDLWSIIRFAE
jgi:hypothetical protein